jgi:hypothetical protein
LYVAVDGMRNDWSTSCEMLTSCAVRLDLFGTRIELSSSCGDAYRSVAFRGLDRLALSSDDGKKIVGSLGLGLRRRAMFTMCANM